MLGAVGVGLALQAATQVDASGLAAAPAKALGAAALRGWGRNGFADCRGGRSLRVGGGAGPGLAQDVSPALIVGILQAVLGAQESRLALAFASQIHGGGLAAFRAQARAPEVEVAAALTPEFSRLGAGLGLIGGGSDAPDAAIELADVFPALGHVLDAVGGGAPFALAPEVDEGGLVTAHAEALLESLEF